MSNLNNNTTQLEALLAKVNALPEAGGSDPVLQDKTVTPTTSTQTVTADSGYDGLDTVIVNAMPIATQATPSITVSSAGLITASATQSAGYVASGTKSATKQLTTQAAKTITPSKSTQTAVASGRYTTGAVTVAAIPDTYIQPSGTLDVTANGTHDVKNYASVNVNVAGGGDLPTLTNEGTPSELLEGKEFIDSSGKIVIGTMIHNGPINSTMDGITTKSIAVPAGYTNGGTVSLDDTIDNEVAEQADLLTQIQTLLETRVANNKIYIGTAEPTVDIGMDGDIYVVRGEN